ncbi:MAG: C1 family peptidase [Candidatus Aminicenantes bacterium]|nr:MAG: C1 family peptidase [Candidatus Aminicenantes bacterium]
MGKPKIFQPTLEQLAKRCSVIEDPPDYRDWNVETAHPSVTSISAREILPPRIDYSDETPEVGDQGDYGSCVGWAAVRGLREWMYQKKSGNKVSLSIRFVWMAAKETDHFEINSFVANAGTSLKTAFKVLKKYGVPEAGYYKDDQELIFFRSLKEKRDFFYNASKFRIYNYYMLTTNEMRKFHLAKIGPFVVTVPIDETWQSVGADGIIPDEGEDPTIGGHALLVVGYDDDRQLFRFKNSWGKAWGDKGFGYFSYKYAEKTMWSAIGTDLVPEAAD